MAGDGGEGKQDKIDQSYLAGTTTAAAGVLADLEPSVDRRRDGSAFLRTVFILIKTLPSPVFSFSFGAGGPPGAGELMLAEGVVSSWPWPSVSASVLSVGARLLNQARSPARLAGVVEWPSSATEADE
jgi:hypothetical protein